VRFTGSGEAERSERPARLTTTQSVKEIAPWLINFTPTQSTIFVWLLHT